MLPKHRLAALLRSVPKIPIVHVSHCSSQSQTSSHTRPLKKHFPYLVSLQTRWSDNDLYGHINNVVYYSFFDTVINTYLIKEGGLDIHSGNCIGLAVETHCNFFASNSFPDEIEAGLRVAKLGKSSVRYEVGIFTKSHKADEPAAAFGHFVHVFVDRTTRRPVSALPTQLRAALERLVILHQPEAKL